MATHDSDPPELAPYNRLARFVAAYGWRAYTIPVLAIATVIALVGIIPPSTSGASASSAADSAGSPSSAPATATPTPTTAQAPAPQPTGAAPTPEFAQQGDNQFTVIPGAGAVLGSGGPLIQFDVSIEGGIVIDGAGFAADVERILADPRSWVATGQLQLQRVDAAAALHIMLVTPANVEGYCPGYGTGGFTSCRNGDRVIINLARWSLGVDDYAGFLGEYREYVINHEVGHYLGHGHVPCAAPGAKAPVMQQQTLGLGGCARNAWPYPNSPADDINAPA